MPICWYLSIVWKGDWICLGWILMRWLVYGMCVVVVTGFLWCARLRWLNMAICVKHIPTKRKWSFASKQFFASIINPVFSLPFATVPYFKKMQMSWKSKPFHVRLPSIPLSSPLKKSGCPHIRMRGKEGFPVFTRFLNTSSVFRPILASHLNF